MEDNTMSISLISIHAPAKGATAQETGISVDTLISIHAPAKGATIQYFFRLGIKEISIHAPAKGATVFKINGIFDFINFNPRSREGSDLTGLFSISSFE